MEELFQVIFSYPRVDDFGKKAGFIKFKIFVFQSKQPLNELVHYGRL